MRKKRKRTTGGNQGETIKQTNYQEPEGKIGK